MNILFISHEKDINGATRSMFDLINCLSQYHHFIILLRFNEGEVYNEVKRRKIDYIYCPYKWWVTTNPPTKINLLVRRLKWAFKWKHSNDRLGRDLSQSLKSMNIDIIHCNSSVTNFGTVLKKYTGAKLVWHIREFGEEDFGSTPLVSRKRFFDSFNQYADKIIVISHAVENKYIGKVSPDKIECIYNGVPDYNLYKKEGISSDKDLVLLQTGPITDVKGQGTAIKAVRELKKRGVEVKLLLAGAGQLIDIGENNFDIAENVILLGKVSNLPEIRKNVDVEIVCSRCEAFGRITIEAMMSSLPVIGTNAGGTPELIKDGINGFLFPVGDYIKLADLIEYFHYNREEILRMGKNAYDYSRDFFSINRCALEVHQLYCNLMKDDK